MKEGYKQVSSYNGFSKANTRECLRTMKNVKDQRG